MVTHQEQQRNDGFCAEIEGLEQPLNEEESEPSVSEDSIASDEEETKKLDAQQQQRKEEAIRCALERINNEDLRDGVVRDFPSLIVRNSNCIGRVDQLSNGHIYPNENEAVRQQEHTFSESAYTEN